MDRCTKCILPANYPSISFNEAGVCSFCSSYKPKKYLGKEILRKRISAILKDRKGKYETYDCVVGVSGGRDSSFILWYVVKKLNLKVIAYTAHNGFVPDVAMRNMHNITEKLDVHLVVEKHSYLKKCLKHHINAFMKAPSPAMIGALCTGCKLGIDLGLLHFARKSRISLVISGGSPLEVGSFKTGLLRSDPANKNTYSFVKGCLREIKKNPKWILHYPSLTVQFREFYHLYYNRTLQNKVSVLVPFYDFVEWDEERLIDTLRNEIGWEFNLDKNSSTWKTDCYIAPVKRYLYKKMLGFNDIDDHLSALIRVGQISREEAMTRLSAESSVPEKVLSDTCDHLGIDRKKLEKVLARQT